MPPGWRSVRMRVAAAGQDLVRVGLVADVPDQPVVRGVEDVVQGHGELDHAQPGAEMPARHRHGVDGLLAQLGRQLHQAGAAEAAQVAGLVDLVEKRRHGHVGQGLFGRAVQDFRLITKSNRSARTVARPAKMSRRANARSAQLGQHPPRARLAQDPDEGGLADRVVAAGVLAGGDTLAAAVEQVVLDLEGEPELLGIAAERGCGARPAPARGWRRPRRRSGSARRSSAAAWPRCRPATRPASRP